MFYQQPNTAHFFFFIPKVFSVTFFFAIESSLSETKTKQSKTAGRFRDETATFKKWSWEQDQSRALQHWVTLNPTMCVA